MKRRIRVVCRICGVRVTHIGGVWVHVRGQVKRHGGPEGVGYHNADVVLRTYEAGPGDGGVCGSI